MCKVSAQLDYEHKATRDPSTQQPILPRAFPRTMVTMPRRRTYSNSSASSAEPDGMEDQFVFSPHQSPGPNNPSFFAPVQGAASNLTRALTQANQYSSLPQNHHKNPPNASNSAISNPPTSNKSSTPHSRPIAIELPPSVTRKINSSSVYTPIEPLSGRGDIAGGFFPFHEDPNKRVHRPHPFHTEDRDVKNHILDPEPPLDGQKGPPQIVLQRPRITKPSISEPQGVPIPKMGREQPQMQSRSHTPVMSYVPSGLHDAHLPLGKYYPSNYEAKQRRSNQPTPNTSRPSSAVGPFSMKSDTAVPQITRTDSSHSRSASDATRRLQQYQRDMVAQATQAARQIASGQGPSAAHLAAAHGVSVQKLQFGSHRPVSPRLQPLGSPGPVTPMELEGDGGYLSRGRPVPSPDAGREDDAIARAIAAEEARMRREGQASPAVEAGGFGL